MGVAGNRIELDGRLVNQPEVRVTPAGTPVIRFIVDCSLPGEELKLGIVMTGDPALVREKQSANGVLADLGVGHPCRRLVPIHRDDRSGILPIAFCDFCALRIR